MNNIYKLLINRILILYFMFFLNSLVIGQEKKIDRAIDALEKGKFLECQNLVNEFKSENINSPLCKYVEYRLYSTTNSPYFNLETSYENLLFIKDWFSKNTPEKKWCKKFDLCSEKINSQLDSIAFMALKELEKNKSDLAYESYFKIYNKSTISLRAWISFYDWKFQLAFDSNSQNKLEDFISKYPNAHNVEKAKVRIEELYYQDCLLKKNTASYEMFLKKYPKSSKVPEINEALINLEFENCKTSYDAVCLEKFLIKYPNNKFNLEAKKKIELIYFENAKKSASQEQLELFLTKYPNSIYLNEVRKELEELKNSVVLTSIGTGGTNEIAEQNALKSAMDRVFSSFISSNDKHSQGTEFSEQLIAATSGYIKSSQVLNEIELANGEFASIVKVVIQRENLRKFVVSKGIEVEFNGGNFAEKIKLQQMNELAEFDALYSLFSVIFEKMQTAFDYEVKTSDPISINDGSQQWVVNVNVDVIGNKILDDCFNTLIIGLDGISMSEEELTSYVKVNKPTYSITFDMTERLMREGKWKPQYEEWNGDRYFTEKKLKKFFFRKKESYNILESLIGQFDFYLRNFEVENNLLTRSHVGNSIKPLELIVENFIRHAYGRGDNDLQSFIVFPCSKDTITTFNYQDFFTLEQLSKLDNYKVKSCGVSVKIKHGGYVIFEENGVGLVLSIADYPISTKQFFQDTQNQDRLQLTNQYNKFQNSISSIELGGVTNWRIPSETEFRIAHQFLVSRYSPKCGYGLSKDENKRYSEDETEIKTVNVCYETPIIYKNDFGGMLTSVKDHSDKKLLRHGASYLKSKYLTSSFLCEIENNSYGFPYKIPFNYKSTTVSADSCLKLFSINFDINQLYNDDNSKSDPNYLFSSSQFDFFKEVTSMLEIPIRLVHSFDENLQSQESINSQNQRTTQIGYQVWMKNNLNVEMFRNGDLIQQVRNTEEWKEAFESKQPAWCYNNFNPSSGLTFGKLYNWYALNDPRGIAPYGWKVPSSIDFRILALEIGLNSENFKSIKGWKQNGNNLSGFNIFPSGCYSNADSQEGTPFSGKYSTQNASLWWTNDGYCIIFNNDGQFIFSNIKHFNHLKNDGYSVRCVQE